MRKEKGLTNLLRGLVDLLVEESERNPEFASKIDALLTQIPERKQASRKSVGSKSQIELPDIHAEWASRGDIDFRIWLRDFPIQELRAIIRTHDFDPMRRSIKWKDSEKLADFVTDALRARLARGSAFIGTGDAK